MMTQKTGALIFDETADRYDIRFDVNDYYGGLHCGDAPADAGNHYQTAGGVAEEAPERPGTMKGAAYEGYFSP